ncbi:hypothetical protein cypCar_00049634 [Cyprinus carpio]|nr:hypothetical protein cypCar_00049634 [Cyprinus carpio]
MASMNSFTSTTLASAIDLVKESRSRSYNKRLNITSREIQTPCVWLLPGELGQQPCLRGPQGVTVTGQFRQSGL